MSEERQQREGLAGEILKKGDLTAKEIKEELWKKNISFVRSYDRPVCMLFYPLAVLWLLPAMAKYSGWGFLNFFARLPKVDFSIVVMVIGTIFLIAAICLEAKVGYERQRQGGCHDLHESVVIVREGPYKVIRHPGYLAELIYFPLLPIVLSKWVPFTILAMVFTVVWIGVTVYMIRAEDNFNIRKWGEAYCQYMKEVPAINVVKGLNNLKKGGERNMTDNLRVEKERKYWDKFAPKYDRFIDKNWKIYPSLLDKISSDVNVGDVVLDVATGTGLVSFKVAQRAKHVYAVDFSPPFIDEANRKVKETGIGNVEFSVEDICSLSFDKDMFDVVICVNSLHFIRDPQKALSEMKRVLKPGGRLIAPTPCIKESPKVRLMMRFYKFFKGMSVCHCFSIEDLLNLIKEFGFDIVKKEIIRHPRDISSMVYIVGERR